MRFKSTKRASWGVPALLDSIEAFVVGQRVSSRGWKLPILATNSHPCIEDRHELLLLKIGSYVAAAT